MRTRRLGRTDLAVTEVGFGAAAIGNLYKPTDDATAAAAVQAAWDAGVRYFDTAPHTASVSPSSAWAKRWPSTRVRSTSSRPRSAGCSCATPHPPDRTCPPACSPYRTP
jgi:hypothetical protein